MSGNTENRLHRTGSAGESESPAAGSITAIIDWTGWSDWQTLLALDWSRVPAGSGAYVIATDRPLNRAIGVDPLGILDIGESKGLARRLADFVRCATCYGDEGHMAGWRFAFFRLARHFPPETLRVRWTPAGSKAEANEIEGRMMLAYIAAHGETPPLNFNSNWSPFRKDGWELFDRMIGHKSPSASASSEA